MSVLRSGSVLRRAALAAGALVLLAGGWAMLAGRPSGSEGRRIVVLGVDGMDYALTRRLMSEGRLPNLAAMEHEGTFAPLATTMPPLSPVAWSTFITGADPGVCGVYDFLRRDPVKIAKGFVPEDAVVRTVANRRRWAVPFTDRCLRPPGDIRHLRRGRPFWERLADAGVDATIYKMPAIWPVRGSESEVLAGMGVPDVEGGYGTFTLLSEGDESSRELVGGRIVRVSVRDGEVWVRRGEGRQRPVLRGPVNPWLRKGDQTHEPLRAAFRVTVDRRSQAAVVELQGCDVVLPLGEWSGWTPVEFPLLGPLATLKGQVRFYLQQVSPRLRLYVSPVHPAPGSPGLSSGGLDVELVESVGSFHTKGMAEPTQALLAGALSTDEYLAASGRIWDEQLRAVDYLLRTRSSGLVFAYLSRLDLDSHVMWRFHDPQHPMHDPNAPARHREHIEQIYEAVDALAGRVKEFLGENDELYILSDHGFTTLRREFNVVTWLEREGYLAYESPLLRRLSEMYEHIDWGVTRAYPVGFNGLYVNLRGREARGCVGSRRYDALVEELRRKLLALRDDNGRAVFAKVYRPGEVYSGRDPARAPDLLLGYAPPYGPSDASVLGSWAPEMLRDRTGGFSGHHAVDPAAVPGVLFVSRPLRAGDATLADVTATLLAEFDVPADPDMTGRALKGLDHAEASTRSTAAQDGAAGGRIGRAIRLRLAGRDDLRADRTGRARGGSPGGDGTAARAELPRLDAMPPGGGFAGAWWVEVSFVAGCFAAGSWALLKLLRVGRWVAPAARRLSAAVDEVLLSRRRARLLLRAECKLLGASGGMIAATLPACLFVAALFALVSWRIAPRYERTGAKAGRDVTLKMESLPEGFDAGFAVGPAWRVRAIVRAPARRTTWLRVRPLRAGVHALRSPGARPWTLNVDDASFPARSRQESGGAVLRVDYPPRRLGVDQGWQVVFWGICAAVWIMLAAAWPAVRMRLGLMSLTPAPPWERNPLLDAYRRCRQGEATGRKAGDP